VQLDLFPSMVPVPRVRAPVDAHGRARTVRKVTQKKVAGSITLRRVSAWTEGTKQQRVGGTSGSAVEDEYHRTLSWVLHLLCGIRDGKGAARWVTRGIFDDRLRYRHRVPDLLTIEHSFVRGDESARAGIGN
jgi:hypothetical protein